jgi:hypothetical protein
MLAAFLHVAVLAKPAAELNIDDQELHDLEFEPIRKQPEFVDCKIPAMVSPKVHWYVWPCDNAFIKQGDFKTDATARIIHVCEVQGCDGR